MFRCLNFFMIWWVEVIVVSLVLVNCSLWLCCLYRGIFMVFVSLCSCMEMVGCVRWRVVVVVVMVFMLWMVSRIFSCFRVFICVCNWFMVRFLFMYYLDSIYFYLILFVWIMCLFLIEEVLCYCLCVNVFLFCLLF